MTMVGVVYNGNMIQFNADDMKAIAEVAAALNMSFEALKEEIQRLLQRQEIARELEKLGELAEIAAERIKQLNYEFVSTRKERVYCSYKPNLHKADKRRCFRPKPYWQRIRSNPR